jgi:MotA/TolQ/ExbB proton channel family protein
LDYVTQKGSAEDYREYLEYLADQDEEITHANYMLIRFVIAVTPILGFLGTVVHFGTALSGFTFEKMAERLPGLVGEMGMAFNTTTVALAAAMTMTFALFVCERIERGIVRSVDRFVERELLNRFEVHAPQVTPFLAAIQRANEAAIQGFAATLQRHLELWTQSLETLFARFDERQQRELRSWDAALDVLQKRHEDYDARYSERIRQSVSQLESHQDKHMSQIQVLLEKAIALSGENSGFAQRLEAITHSEGKLLELQSVLGENLRLLNETGQIDKALHGLTAAIHLLTARHRGLDGLAAA